MLEFAVLAAQCAPQIHPNTLAAIVRHESGANPYAIGINGGARLPRQPANKAEAISTARWLYQNGYNFDSGLGQINIKNLPRLGMAIEDMFEPCTNLRAAAVVLEGCYRRAATAMGGGQRALHAALSCYNTGDFNRGFQNGYVTKVVARAGSGPATTPNTNRVEPIRPVSKTLHPSTRDNNLRHPVDAFSSSPKDAFTRTKND